MQKIVGKNLSLINHERSNTTDCTGKPIASIAVAKGGLDLMLLVACHAL
jgi:hypothetical protein